MAPRRRRRQALVDVVEGLDDPQALLVPRDPVSLVERGLFQAACLYAWPRRAGRLRRETSPAIHFTERRARSATIGRGSCR